MKNVFAILAGALPLAMAAPQLPKGIGNSPVPNGPAPAGCNAYEIIIGTVPEPWVVVTRENKIS
jgi:hypothetical protein